VYFACVVLKLNIVLSFVISALLMAGLGLLLERFLFRRFKGNVESSIIVAIGLILLLQTVAVLAFGSSDKSIPRLISGVLVLGDIRVSWDRVLAVVVGLVMVSGLYIFVKFTKLGQAMVAASQDPVAAALQGMDTNRISAISMAIGCGLAAVAGGLMGSIYSVEPYMGSFAISKALAVIILGGLGSFVGAVVGGLIIGVIDGVVPLYYNTTVAYIVSLACIVLILIAKPQGLFGEQEQ
jgi:branched-chain amino acid transport system permease protein